MSWLDETAGPTDAELWAIEAEADLLAAEVALVDAETTLFDRPGRATAAAYLQALMDVVDLHDYAGHDAPLVQPGFGPTTRRCLRTVSEAVAS